MLLEIINLTKIYNGKPALNDFTVSFSPGIYGILGANGAGKSTFMNLLTDNIKREKGYILYNSIDILKIGVDYRRKIGYMPQHNGYYEQMSVISFLQYIAKLKGVKRKASVEQISMLLSKTNMEEHIHKRMKNLSGGMKQRVLLMQALLGEPEIIILDEPTAGLDPQERVRIRNFISSISKNRIILLATHIVSDIESIADSVVMMQSGKLVQFDTSQKLQENLVGKVFEIPYSSIEKIKRGGQSTNARFSVVNLFHKNGIPYARIVGDELHLCPSIREDRITLEDVYMYYLSTH